MPIRWHDRLFLAGQSSSGKSEVLNYLFTRIRTRKVLLDTKGEFGIPGIAPTRSADHLLEQLEEGGNDDHNRVFHFQELSGDLDEYDRVCFDVMQRRDVVLCCHELADLCDDLPNRTPKWVRQGIRKGNVFGNGWLSATQRPVGMPRQARTEAQHVMQMVPALDPEDHRVVARMMGLTDHELHQHLHQAAEQSPTGQFSWVWFDRRARQVVIVPPLTDQQRGQIMVTRTANV